MKKRLLPCLLFLTLCTSCTTETIQTGGSPTADGNGVEASADPTQAASPTEPASTETAAPTPNIVLMDFDEDLTAAELAADMGRGWNLGNTLDAIKSSGASPMQQETAWGNPVTTEDMIKLLADAGFKTLRIPTTWEAFIGPAPDHTVDERMLDRVQEIVDWAFRYDLYVILNLHHEEWYTPTYDNRPDAEPKLKAVWEQIATRFAGYSEKLIFEVMNEPRVKGSKNEWSGGTAEEREVLNHYNKAAVDQIRRSAGHNDKRFLMVPTYAASGDDSAANGFVVPGDDRVLVSIHSYAPYNFALNTGGTSEWSLDNPNDTKDIDNVFARIDKNFLQKGYTVVMGEFGAMNKDNEETRAAWLRYYMEVADRYGVPCVWWDNGGVTGSGELFGLMDRRNLGWTFPTLLEAFFN